MPDILTYVLHYEGALNKNSLGASQRHGSPSEIGGECHAVVVGGDDLTDELCQSLGAYGATKVFRAKGEEGPAQPVIDVMAKVIDDNGRPTRCSAADCWALRSGPGSRAQAAGVTMEVTAVGPRRQARGRAARFSRLQDLGFRVTRATSESSSADQRVLRPSRKDGGSAEVIDVDVEYSPWSTQGLDGRARRTARRGRRHRGR